jgi:SAM-dependent methyltransferase
MHEQLTKEIADKYVGPLNLAKDAKILDLGCGPGYFLDWLKEKEFTNYLGVSLSPGDIKMCEEKGHTIKKYDMSFLPQREGYYDESVDFIFLRHALEHSPYPIFTIMEYNRVLKQGSKMYIEVPAPDCERKHEYNLNHYSILGENQLVALLTRCGFNVDEFNNLEFDIQGKDNEGNDFTAREKFYCILVTKQRPLDIK